MPTYETLDFPNLTTNQIANAPTLDFPLRTNGGRGINFLSSDLQMTLNADPQIYRFLAVSGSRVALTSFSFFDPDLIVYDEAGRAIFVNAEGDDEAIFSRGNSYRTDMELAWTPPYTGYYYVDAGYHTAQSDDSRGILILALLSQSFGNPEFRAVLSSGSTTTVGGVGQIIGTSSADFVIIPDEPGVYAFDPSFNKGGDVIRLPGNGSDYVVEIVGSSIYLQDDFLLLSIPVGPVGTALVFDDGARSLMYDPERGTVLIGEQLLDNDRVEVASLPQNLDLPSPDSGGSTKVLLAEAARVSVASDSVVYGTIASETIRYEGGSMILDPSFNRGGDHLVLGEIDDFTAQVVSSNLVLSSARGEITLPVGLNSTFLQFGEETAALRIDPVLGQVVLGDFVLGRDEVSLTAAAVFG